MEDSPRVLVAHATADGSTAGVAERIAGRLRSAGCLVDSAPVGPGLDPGSYDAVVVGSAVHDMAWLSPALDLLRRIPESTATWFFSVGGLAPAGPITRRMTTLEVGRVEQGFPPALRGRDHRLFAGVVSTGGLALRSRIFWRLVGGRDGDHRDWPAIDAWAESIGARLTGSRAGRGCP
jgi:menaquinone-dependent protoporphyrinogen oxidase